MAVFVILSIGCVFAAFLTSIDIMMGKVGMGPFLLVFSVLAITFFVFAIVTISPITGRVMLLCSLPLAMIGGSLWLIAKILRKSSSEAIYTTAIKGAKSLIATAVIIVLCGVICMMLV